MKKRKSPAMGEVRKMTISAMMCAMTVAMLAVASFLGDLDLTILMVASLCMVFVYVEIGHPYTYLTWLVSSLLTFLFFPSRYFWVVYLFIFGFYPILKGFIERLMQKALGPLNCVAFDSQRKACRQRFWRRRRRLRR